MLLCLLEVNGWRHGPVYIAEFSPVLCVGVRREEGINVNCTPSNILNDVFLVRFLMATFQINEAKKDL